MSQICNSSLRIIRKTGCTTEINFFKRSAKKICYNHHESFYRRTAVLLYHSESHKNHNGENLSQFLGNSRHFLKLSPRELYESSESWNQSPKINALVGRNIPVVPLNHQTAMFSKQQISAAAMRLPKTKMSTNFEFRVMTK